MLRRRDGEETIKQETEGKRCKRQKCDEQKRFSGIQKVTVEEKRERM